VVLLVSALRQGQYPAVTLQKLKGLCGVWRTTIKLWQRFFQKLFPQTVSYRRLVGHLIPPIEPDQLPGALLARFYPSFGHGEEALSACLRVLALGP
jgi:hypothetical protein